MRPLLLSLLLAATVLSTGCPPENYPNLVGATLTDANRIVTNEDLTAEEKRSQLAALGFDPITMNALLRDERLANQFGGDLRTAYAKVANGRFNELTPDEVQIYADEASAVEETDPLDVNISDSGAQAIVSLFQAQVIRTEQDLLRYLGDPANEIPEAIPDNVLTPLFIDFDPALLIPKLP